MIRQLPFSIYPALRVAPTALAIQDERVQRIALQENCMSEQAARTIVRKELNTRGFSDWTIETGGGIAGEGFSSIRPCASLAFDEQRQTVILVPAPKPGTPPNG